MGIGRGVRLPVPDKQKSYHNKDFVEREVIEKHVSSKSRKLEAEKMWRIVGKLLSNKRFPWARG